MNGPIPLVEHPDAQHVGLTGLSVQRVHLDDDLGRKRGRARRLPHFDAPHLEALRPVLSTGIGELGLALHDGASRSHGGFLLELLPALRIQLDLPLQAYRLLLSSRGGRIRWIKVQHSVVSHRSRCHTHRPRGTPYPVSVVRLSGLAFVAETAESEAELPSEGVEIK